MEDIPGILQCTANILGILTTYLYEKMRGKGKVLVIGGLEAKANEE